MRSYVALALLCSLGTSARADEEDAAYVPPDYLAAPPALPPGYDEAKVWRLDLAEALAVAVKQNLGVTLARKQLEMVRLGGVAANGDFYDTTVGAGYNHGNANSPPPTIQAGLPGSSLTSTTDAWYLTLGQRLPTGATIGVGVTTSRTNSNWGTAVEPINYVSGVSVSVKQPLFRGFSRDLVIPQMSLLTAELGSESARHDVELKATGVVQQTEAAYWALVLELYSYGVVIKAQKLAEDTVALTRRQIDAGISLAADLPGVKSTLAKSKLDVLAAEASITTASDALRVALNLPREQWDRPLLPTEPPRFEPAVVTSDEAALATAIKHRPDLAEVEIGLKSSVLATRVAENNTLPDISLGVTAQAQGQAASLPGTLGQLHDNTGWAVTLDVAWTPRGRAGAARAEIARIQHAVNTATRDGLVQTIWSQVRGAIRDQRAAALRVTAASQARTLANETLDIENRKYTTGAATNLTISTRQHELAEAELSELRALLQHQAAATALLVATGRLLEHRHIELGVKRP